MLTAIFKGRVVWPNLIRFGRTLPLRHRLGRLFLRLAFRRRPDNIHQRQVTPLVMRSLVIHRRRNLHIPNLTARHNSLPIRNRSPVTTLPHNHSPPISSHNLLTRNHNPWLMVSRSIRHSSRSIRNPSQLPFQ